MLGLKVSFSLVLVCHVFSLGLGQDVKSQAGYDSQLLNYQLQQLALQQYSGLQGAQPQQYAGLQSAQYSALQAAQPQDYAGLQSAQYSALQAAQQQQLSNSQGPQQFPNQAVQFPNQAVTQQAQQQVQQQAQQQALNAQYLQQTLYQQPSYQSQIAGAQAYPQTSQDALFQSRQQLPKQNLIGVAYSSAADASRTSFTGYGVKYSF